MLVVIDYGLGNLASIKNILKKIGCKEEISNDISEISKADKLILPGVGSFAKGMQNIKERNLIPVLSQKISLEKVPVLGLCLGMQLLTLFSEEGNAQGLGWIPAQTRKFKIEDLPEGLKIPHMGWTDVKPIWDHFLFEGLHEEARFYFVHSYYVTCENRNHVLATARYGKDFDCAFAAGNIMGVQFHPEKSHRFGMRLLENFIRNT